MAEYIEREAAITELRRWSITADRPRTWMNAIDKAVEVVDSIPAADAIEELMAIREEQKAQIIAMAAEDKPRWIPVTERLPEKDGTFITAYSKGGVSQNWYMTFHHGGKWYQNSEDTGEVTHWMPLPEPPKEE